MIKYLKTRKFLSKKRMEVLIKEANNTIVKCKDYLKWSDYINGSCGDYTSKYQCQTHGYIVDPITGVSANDACCVSTM